MNPAEMRQRLRNYARTQPAKAWFRIENLASGMSEVHIMDEIGFFGVTAADLCDQMAQLDDPITVFINCPGGEIFEGIAIYNSLLRRNVSVNIEGIAASAASFIAQAAAPGKLGMARTARMMVHNGQGFVAGDADDLRKTADILEKETRNIASIYAERSGRPLQHFLDMMNAETWLSADEAVAEGLADFVYDPRTGPSNVLARRPRNADNGGWLKRDGKWVFDPMDDGDDDYQASTDTDHDYWSEDGMQLKPIPASPDGECPAKPMPKKNKHGRKLKNAVDNSPWDASKAWHNGTESDDPAAFYEGICAGRKAGDKSTQEAWALPYKYHPSDPPNAAGVRNALSRLPQTEGLTNEADARATLQKAMKQVNPDWEPDDSVSLSHLVALGGE